MRKKSAYILLIILLFSSFLTGCKNTSEQKPINPNKKQIENNERGWPDSERRVISSKISNLAEEAQEINRASVVVTRINIADSDLVKNMTKPKKAISPGAGIIVVIGANVDENIQGDIDKWNKVRQAVIEKIKSSDASISEVYITADPEIAGRIDGIAADMMQGEAASQYEEEVKDIINKLSSR